MNQVVVKQEKSGYQIVEAYKSLRTNLQFCGEDKKVIAITSCTPNEGKSSSIDAAWYFTGRDRKTSDSD